MDKDLLLAQLRDRYKADPEEAINLLLDYLSAAADRSPELFEEHVVQLLALIPETQEHLFDDADMITCVGEE